VSYCASRVIEPVSWAPAQLISTNATNPDPAWSTGTYADGAQVTHPASYGGISVPHQWRSLADGNTTTPGADPTYWQDLGPANTVALFDPIFPRTEPRTWGLVSRKTTRTGSLQMVVKPGAFASGLGLFGLQGNAVTVDVLAPDGTTVVQTQSQDLRTRFGITGWVPWLWTRWEFRDRAIFTGLPCRPGHFLRITITAPDGTPAAVGAAVYGRESVFAQGPEKGAQWSLATYLTPERDEFGNLLGVVRNAPRNDFISAQAWFDKGNTPSARAIFERLVNAPAVWVLSGDSDQSLLVALGFFNNLNVNHQGLYQVASFEIIGAA
jgi:hypothetical protein